MTGSTILNIQWIVYSQVIVLVCTSTSCLDSNERDNIWDKIVCVEICTKAYKSQLRGSLPRFLVLTQVSHLRDEFRNFIPKSERYSNMPYFRIAGWIWWRYRPYQYDRKFSSYFPSMEMHSEFGSYLCFISNHQVNERKLVRSSTYLALGLFLRHTLPRGVGSVRICEGLYCPTLVTV